MFVNSEPKVAGFTEVLVAQLVLLHLLRKELDPKIPPKYKRKINLQSLLKDFHGLGSTNGAVDGNLFISSNTEATNSQSGY
jgi:hypothetical protein